MTDDTRLALFILAVHLIICVVIALLVRFRVLDIRGYFFPFMVFVPLFGPLCVLALHTRAVIFGHELAMPAIEKLRINDERYRSILVEGRGEADITAPIEEVMIVNSSEQRRSLILSILNDSPEDYIDLLQQACLNEDTEVMHYASTAMAQISKEADIKLQKLERRYAAHPDDPEVLDEYSDYLKEYLESGLVQGRAAEIQQRQYLELLKKQLAAREDYDLSCRLTQLQIDIKDYDAAEESINKMMPRWPWREGLWLLRIKLAAARKDIGALHETERLIKENNVYLSSKGREVLRFWQGDTEGGAQ